MESQVRGQELINRRERYQDRESDKWQHSPTALTDL